MQLVDDKNKTIHEEYLISQRFTVKGCSKFNFLESPQQIKIFILLNVVDVPRKRWKAMLEKYLTIVSEG